MGRLLAGVNILFSFSTVVNSYKPEVSLLTTSSVGKVNPAAGVTVFIEDGRVIVMGLNPISVKN